MAKPRQRRFRLPGGLTGNALVTALISAVVSGIISYFIAHQQAEDSARQAVTGQQVQQIIELEADVRTFYAAAGTYYHVRALCGSLPASSAIPEECKSKGSVLDNPMTKALLDSEDTLSTDLANISDPVATKDTGILEGYVTVALYNAANNQGGVAWGKAEAEYSIVIMRCGQLIQGQN
jgi:hypothetical protein